MRFDVPIKGNLQRQVLKSTESRITSKWILEYVVYVLRFDIDPIFGNKWGN